MSLNPYHSKIESFRIRDADSNFEIPVEKLLLEAEIQPNEVGALKSGEWILLNTMPWFLELRPNNSFKRIFERIIIPDVVFGIKRKDLTAVGVDSRGLPDGLSS